LSVPADNPFSRVYDALWKLAMRSRMLATLVKPGNRITFGDLTDSSPLKGKIAPADLPELVLTVRSLSANLHNTSTTSMCTRNYAWMASCGDFRYSQIASPLEWALFSAMAGWRSTLSGLLWNDKTFCKRMTLSGGSTGLSDAANNRNIQGWSTVWALDIDMVFDQADLDAEIEQTGITEGQV
jgi:hypothetical protein